MQPGYNNDFNSDWGDAEPYLKNGLAKEALQPNTAGADVTPDLPTEAGPDLSTLPLP